MIIAKRIIEGAQVPNAAGVLFTSEDVSGVRTLIKKLTFCNTSGGTVTVTVYLVPKGGAPGVTNTVWSAQPILAGKQAECYEAENQVLEQGDMIQAVASAATSVTAIGSGIILT